MNDKRFYLKQNHIIDSESKLMNMEQLLSYSEVCELLNELHEMSNYFERKKCEYWNKFNLAHLDNINLRKENEQLKRDNELLSDELEQCKAVIDNRWKEYLDKKGDVE